MQPLPVDNLLDEIVASLVRTPSLVLEAPPGAGKTTRVPPALLRADVLAAPEILVLQPRRLAARWAAAWVAGELGEKVGERVGYQVRFDERVGRKTRIKFITEALLVRRLLTDPTLERVGAVIFDEFHERHLATDVGLAMMTRLRAKARPDLRILIMSATLETKPIAAYLGDCPVLRSEGRRFPVEIEHLSKPDERPLEIQVASALRRLLDDDLDGDVLVFLPGAREIRRAAEASETTAKQHDLLVLPLHGELPPEEQDRAVRPADRRKVILSTNVAESSVTIDGVAAVIDSGLARRAGHDPWSGLPTLRVRPVSRASAAQRAGRAGRTRAGRCFRLYTRHDHDTRPAHEKPEVERLDLTETVLLLATLGAAEPDGVPWLEAPPESALASARELLRRLGAVDDAGRVTDDGRRMAALPVHPRQGRIIVEAARRGRLEAGCTVAALLGDRDLRRNRREAKESGPSDLLALADALDEACQARFSPRRLLSMGLAAGRARGVARVRDQLIRLSRKGATGGAPSSDGSDDAILMAILSGYPDRVARQRTGGGRRRGDREILLALGGSALLSNGSVVRDPEWMVAVEAEQRQHSGGRPIVRLASAIDPSWLLDLFPHAVRATDALEWDPETERVESTSRLEYESLILEESRQAAEPSEAATALLREAAIAAGPAAFGDREALTGLIERIACVRRAAGGADLPALSHEDAVAALEELCEGRRSFAELRDASLLDALRARLGPHARRLDELAPAQVTLPGGRRLRVTYEPDKPPWVESFLQDFFGRRDGPSVVNGKVPVTLHLLAPNRRAVQVTTDLAGFWEKHYPTLRKSLSRRYPRHDWPEDPANARPPPPSGRKKRRR
ncbi:MAG: ATP-dependent helicase HrpB [Myxococcota bacterium]